MSLKHNRDLLLELPTLELYQQKRAEGKTKQESFEEVLKTAQETFEKRKELEKTVREAKVLIDPYADFIEKNGKNFYGLAHLKKLTETQLQPFFYGSQQRGAISDYFPVATWKAQNRQYNAHAREIKRFMDNAQKTIDVIKERKDIYENT